MNRNGYSLIINLCVVMGILLIGAVLYYKLPAWVPSYSATLNPLKDSDIAPLITLLQKNNLQAAVIEQIYQPNNASIWLVKANGQKILMYAKDLGTYLDVGFPIPYYTNDLSAANPRWIFLAPGAEEIYDLTYRKEYDISKYINGDSANVLVEDDQNNRVALSWATNPGNPSPNARYMITYPKTYPPTIELNSVQIQNGKIAIDQHSMGMVVDPIAPLPADRFIAWAPDSNYLLLSQGAGTTLLKLAVYDIQNKKIADGIITLNRTDTAADRFSVFLPPSTLVFSKNAAGTFSLDFSRNNQTPVGILPIQIKLVGLIPAKF